MRRHVILRVTSKLLMPFILMFASGFLGIGVASLRSSLHQMAIESGERVIAETTPAT